MKFVHISDLHLGKRVNEFNMLEDQAHILGEILRVTDETRPDAVLIAGDVYDKPTPSAEAVRLFDDFLCALADRKLQVFVISGNHDSPERIAFASRLIDGSGVHLSPVYDGDVRPVTLEDEYGAVDVYMLPFVRPSSVRRHFPDREITSYTDALRAAVDAMDIDFTRRNVLVAHQFITGSKRSDSEDVPVGGLDNADASVFDGIDYVALGHLHIPQNVGSGRIRYCGSPLKYSFSEALQEKSVTVVTMKEKGDTEISAAPLRPLRDMRAVRGTYMELTAKDFYEGTDTEAYMHFTLTDEDDIPDAVGKLRAIYPNIMKLEYDNARTRAHAVPGELPPAESRSPVELFAELYEMQNGRPLSGEQEAFSAGLMKEVWEDA